MEDNKPKRYSYCTCGHTYWQHSGFKNGFVNRCLKCDENTWHEFEFDNLKFLEDKYERSTK
jgi:hypothetical protein